MNIGLNMISTTGTFKDKLIPIESIDPLFILSLVSSYQ